MDNDRQSEDLEQYDVFLPKDIYGNYLTTDTVKEILEKNKQRLEKESRILGNVLGGVIGFAVGDALGVPVEFTTRDVLKCNPVKDMTGYGTYAVPAGTWSDDTSMMIAMMDSMTEKEEIDFEDIMKKFCNWLDDAEYTATDKVFDVGITTGMAIRNYKTGNKKAIESGMSGIRENGNGSLMRMLPIAFYIAEADLTEDEEVKIVNDFSSMTHSHEISKLGCKIYTDYVKELIIKMRSKRIKTSRQKITLNIIVKRH